MTIAVASPIFVDTNVLVFASLQSSRLHKSAQAALHGIFQQNIEAWVSRQVLREFLVQITRPGTLPAGTPAVAALQVKSLESLFRIADETEPVTDELLDLLTTIGAAGKQIHDANIVATMQANGIPRVLTNNVKDFKRYSHLITIVPLEP